MPKESAKARSGGGGGRGTSGGGGGRGGGGHQRTQSMRLELSPAAPGPAETGPIHRSNSAPAVAEAAEQAQQAQQQAAQQLAQPAAPPAQRPAEQAVLEQGLLPQAQQTQLQPQAAPAAALALARQPSWQLRQRFMQQQLELERHIQQRLAGLQAEAERQRRLLEQQQQHEATNAAVLASNDLDFLLMEDLPPGPSLADAGAAEPGAAVAQPLPQLSRLQTQGSHFSEGSTGWAYGGSPDAHSLLVCPPPAAGPAHVPSSLSPAQPSSATQAPPPPLAQHLGWAPPPAHAASGVLTGGATGSATAYREAAEEAGQGCVASAPPPKRQQLPVDRLQPPVDVFDAAMWDSLLTDAGGESSQDWWSLGLAAGGLPAVFCACLGRSAGAASTLPCWLRCLRARHQPCAALSGCLNMPCCLAPPRPCPTVLQQLMDP